MKILTYLILFLFTQIDVFAQQSKVVFGESSIRIEVFMSQNEAEEKVVELAKIDALIREFGQYIEQQSDMQLQNGKVDFRSYGQTKVKGEWIRTLGEPEFKFEERPDKWKPERWISCKIKGEVRRATPKADLQVEVLRCPDLTCVSEKFKSEQALYLYVKSPIDGYLSVFLDDRTTVYRLLPYRLMESQKSVKVGADKGYIFFSPNNNTFSTPADALQVFTERDLEVNTLIVVFSENDYGKPRLDDEKIDKENFIIPKSMSRSYFENWLGNNRAGYSDFLDIKKQIFISRN